MKFVEGLHIKRETITSGLLRVGGGPKIVVPERIDNRSGFLPSSNQGNTPQCAAYAIAGWLEYWRWKLYGIYEQITPLYLYNLAKQVDGRQDEPGTTLDAIVKAAQMAGYLRADAKVAVVENWKDVRRVLHEHEVMLAGLEVDDGWYKARPDGWVPAGTEKLGGHAVCLCGYDSVASPSFDGQNSWSDEDDEWGWHGFFRITPKLFERQYVYGVAIDATAVVNTETEGEAA